MRAYNIVAFLLYARILRAYNTVAFLLYARWIAAVICKLVLGSILKTYDSYVTKLKLLHGRIFSSLFSKEGFFLFSISTGYYGFKACIYLAAATAFASGEKQNNFQSCRDSLFIN